MNKFYIWEGLYKNFKEAVILSKGKGFSSNKYKAQVKAAAIKTYNSLNNNKYIPFENKQRNLLLSTIVSLIKKKNEEINILDFGGGLGIGYMCLKEGIANKKIKYKYNILEVPDVCKIGKVFFKNENNIKYIQKLENVKGIDLIYSSSAIQYIENWEQILQKFCQMKPDYIFLSDVFAGDIPTYCTLQNYYESKIPHWFLNLNDLVTVFEKEGYTLIVKIDLPVKRLNSIDELDMSNFPKKYRIPQTINLLFEKIKK